MRTRRVIRPDWIFRDREKFGTAQDGWSGTSCSCTSAARAEHDPLSNDILIGDGYRIADGAATLPAAPGAGLEMDEKRFAAEAKVRFDLEA